MCVFTVTVFPEHLAGWKASQAVSKNYLNSHSTAPTLTSFQISGDFCNSLHSVQPLVKNATGNCSFYGKRQESLKMYRTEQISIHEGFYMLPKR